jgi:hypothetical protein
MNRWGRRWALLCLTLPLVTLLASAGARAQDAAGADPTTKITLDLRDVPFRTAIEALFERTGLQYAVEPAVPNIPVTLTVRDIDFTTALRTLTRLAGVTYRKESTIYVIGLRPPPTTQTDISSQELAPTTSPEQQLADQTWEKIPILFNSYQIMAYAFGGSTLPTEADLFGLSTGGGGGFGGGSTGFAGPLARQGRF